MTKDDIKISNSISKFKVACSCGHTMPIVNVDRMICSWCGHWVYKNKQLEFKYRLLETAKKQVKNIDKENTTIV